MLVFFMVTTVMKEEKGLSVLLPAFDNSTAPVHDCNIFTIQINSADQFLIEGQPRTTLVGLRNELKEFIFNHGRNPKSSDSPVKAVVSLKPDRGTSYIRYVEALDEIQSAYYEIYAMQAGISPELFRKLDLNNPKDHSLYNKGREGVPMNISISDPTKVPL
jgi:biopolymer transport protein ExbD